MLLLKNVDVYLFPMSYMLLVVGFHAIAGQLVRVKLEKDTTNRNDQVCRPGTECVPGSEFCDINLGLENRQKCGLGHELSMSFCCPVDKVIPPKRYRRVTDDDDDDESDLDKHLDKIALVPIKPFQEETECGLNIDDRALEITESKNAEVNHLPWIVALIDTTGDYHFCGGVLLNRRFVLTATHCFKKNTKKDTIVRLGEYDFNFKNETRFTDHVITDIRLHPDYEKSTHANDIAILRLKEPAKYSAFVQPICLPKKDMEVHEKYGVVAGWGQIVYKGNLSEVLLEVTIPIWEHKKCVEKLSQPIFKTNLCAAAYEGGKDACKGDSGGPLLFQREDGRWTTIGVVSWGIRCGEVGLPGVYTKVTSYLKWIAVNTLDYN